MADHAVGAPARNSYLKSELINFLATLAGMAASADNEDYRRGFLAALAALAGLIGVSIEGVNRGRSS